MKLMIAIKSQDGKVLEDRALRWCGRLGFEIRVFVPKKKRAEYIEIINDANYNWYLAMDPEQVIVSSRFRGTLPNPAQQYARRHGFDLILYVPENLGEWKRGLAFSEEDIKIPYETIASARGEFSRGPRKLIIRWNNGCFMERVKK
jgi:hypothetical protein